MMLTPFVLVALLALGGIHSVPAKSPCTPEQPRVQDLEVRIRAHEDLVTTGRGTLLNLDGFSLEGADLKGRNLERAILRNTCLRWARLQGARLNFADLDGADLTHADLQGSHLVRTQLRGAKFEPNHETIKEVKWAHSALGLDALRYNETRIALTTLRELFRNQGLREEERKLTKAIRVSDRRKAIERGTLGGWVEGAFNYVAFELTSEYGLRYDRPLWLLVLLIPVFALVYMIPIVSHSSNIHAGLWILKPPEALDNTDITGPARLTRTFPASPSKPVVVVPVRRAIGFALYFSVLSAFNIGWRDLNIGSWIARLQPGEFAIRPVGWVRTVSGLQSLVGVYLLALWALTCFGRPFD